MKERLIVQFEPEQLERLRALAAARGVSLAALVRDATDTLIEEHARAASIERALSVAGKHRSGLRDLGRNHDRYLGEGEW